MVDDVKSLTKKCTDLEKRLKFAEAKLKVVVDSMTSSKDIENYLEVLYKKMSLEMAMNQTASRKLQNREMEMSERASQAREKERDKEWDKESKLRQKESDKQYKEAVHKSEMNVMQARLMAVEAQVQSLLKR